MSGVTTDQPDGGAAPVEVADRRQLWRWVWAAARPFVGWLLVLLGALALFLGWYGVSGEAVTAKQIPYLISGGLTGIALIILAAVVLATDNVRRELSRLTAVERRLDDLYRLFADEVVAPASDAAPASDTAARPAARGLVALPGGTSYHRPDCSLVTGKSDAVEVDPAEVSRRRLRPCRVCDPTPGS